MTFIRKFESSFSLDEILLIKRSIKPLEKQADNTFQRYHAKADKIPSFLLKKLSSIVVEANSELGLELFQPINFESFTYAVYQPGDSCVVHNDTCTTHLFQTPARKFTVIVGMNELASYTGGELVFHYTDGIDELNLDSLVARGEVKLGLGDVLIFPSIIYHEVKPIINGMRESLVTLILGPAFK